MDFGEDNVSSVPIFPPEERALSENLSTVSEPVATSNTDAKRAAKRLAGAERARKYRASLSEEKKAQIRAKDNERKRLHWENSLTEEQKEEIRAKKAEIKRLQRESLSPEQLTEMRRKDAMSHSLQRIRRRVASTDFTQDNISEVNNIHTQQILFKSKLPNL